MQRRTLLTAVGTGALALAGCASDGDDADGGAPRTTPRTDGPDTDEPGTDRPGTDRPGTDGGTTDDDPPVLPESCPTSQDLDVDVAWPTDPDADAVSAFVEAYEAAYYREVVVDYDPETPLADYELYGGVEGVREADDGWIVAYSGQGAVYQGSLYFEAEPAEAPEGADVVPAGEVEDDRLTALVEGAVENGTADDHVYETGPLKRYLDALPALSDDVDELTERGQEETLYVDADGTVVAVTVTAGNFHGDYWWTARYYVTDRVVRRAEGEDADPREGKLLECRTEG
jgi:hypothetical protein